jgi:hypothetical protein
VKDLSADLQVRMNFLFSFLPVVAHRSSRICLYLLESFLLLDAVGANFLVQILQKVTDEYMKKIESIQKQKEQVLFLIYLLTFCLTRRSVCWLYSIT